jgi:hypothetical protein
VLKGVAVVLVIAMLAMLLPVVILPMAGPAQAARVVFAEAPDPSRLPAGISIDSWDGHYAVLDGVDASNARKLYAWGALIVYPVRPSGCLAIAE